MMDRELVKLRRVLNKWDNIAIIVGVVIGVGIFRVPAEVANYLPTAAFILLAWFVGGIICLLGSLCYGELTTSFPEAGGNYIYLRESYGKLVGFLFGWTELSVVRTGSIAAVAFIFGEYFKLFFSIDNLSTKFIAISIVIILSAYNIFGLHKGRILQNISTIIKVLALAIIILLGFFSKKGDISHLISYSVTTANRVNFQVFCLALIPILWTYGGWHECCFMAEETKDYKKGLPFSLIVGMLLIILIYIAINLVYLYLIPISEMVNTKLIGSSVMGILYGDFGKRVMEILVIISSLGCINAMIITGSRVTYAMAKDNVLFNYISKVNLKYRTPIRAIIINAIWSVVLIWWGTFNKLLFFTSLVVWLFFALVVGGLFILRAKFPDRERPFKVYFYPLVPIIFILICSALFINTIICFPMESCIGLGIMACGIPIYLLSERRK